MSISHQIVNIILSVTLIATFIGVFFFTYGKTVEENVVKTQSEFIATSLANDVSMFIGPEQAKFISKQITAPDMSQQDAEVSASNAALQKHAYTILAIAGIIGLLVSYGISRMYDMDFGSLLKSNLIILAGVAMTEYVFLTYIGQNFISADPNFVRYKILSVLKSKLPSIPYISQK